MCDDNLILKYGLIPLNVSPYPIAVAFWEKFKIAKGILGRLPVF